MSGTRIVGVEDGIHAKHLFRCVAIVHRMAVVVGVRQLDRVVVIVQVWNTAWDGHTQPTANLGCTIGCVGTTPLVGRLRADGCGFTHLGVHQPS